MTSEHTTDTATAIVAKVTPPIGVSLATVAGYQVSELMIWATLIYTVLMICHKCYQIYKEVKD
jgi:hypothetical protein